LGQVLVESNCITERSSIDQGGGSGQTLSGDAEGSALGAGVAIAADFAVAPGSDVR
jgi:hypothetical protein